MELLVRQAETGIPDMVSIKYGRMLESPYAFSRGAATVMACDLAATPTSGLWVQACGDAHFSNFRAFATPGGRVIFDVNDFDETLPAPWEWDVKRLAASLAEAGRHNGFLRKHRVAIVRAAIRAYREAIRDPAVDKGHLAQHEWLQQVSRASDRRLAANGAARALDRARDRGGQCSLSSLTHMVDGERRLILDPPRIVPVAELYAEPIADEMTEAVIGFLRSYHSGFADPPRVGTAGYRLTDLARSVVGVSGIGIQAWIALLECVDTREFVFLQVKEARASAFEQARRVSVFEDAGERIVAGQRMLQITTDKFLGWNPMVTPGGGERTFYARQLSEPLAAPEIGDTSVNAMTAYGQRCGVTLARAHARSGDGVAIGSYMGSSERFDICLAEFAEAYSDQNEIDYCALVEASQTGRVEARTGL